MDAPKAYKDAGLMHLIAGILNFITAGVWVLAWIWLCVGVLWLVPMGLAAWQAYVGYEMQAGRRVGQAGNMGIIGLVTSFFNFNIFAIVLSVLALMKAKEPDVAGYLGTSG